MAKLTKICLLLLVDTVSALSSSNNSNKPEQSLVRRAFLVSSVLAGAKFVYAQTNAPKGFRRIPTQFIAALGDPNSSSGIEARDWGLWPVDPGPRGVWLDKYKKELLETDGMAPAGWKFDPKDWWLVEEHGLIMEPPGFPLAAGRYLVTGGRITTTILNVDNQGGWNLEDNAKLKDVTHLPCRSARYHPVDGGSPLMAKSSDFPVMSGASMPQLSGCSKQDYAVLFVIDVES